MRVQILGTGCPKCEQLLAHAQQAVAELGLAAEVEKVEDIAEIARSRVLAIPALVVDGVVKAAGRVLSPEDIKKLLQG